jgi:hypothetical protein
MAMGTLEEVIAYVKKNAAEREGTAPLMSELFVAEIESLRASNAAKDTRIIRLKIERDAYLTALNKAAPEKTRELAMRFEEKEPAS